jgi:nicotinamide-nucleotide amidase
VPSTPAGPTLADLLGVPGAALTRLIGALTDRGLTVATAESLTGGLLAACLTEVPGSSAVVRGGLVVYATDLKSTLAGVDPQLLAERGPVDPDVAAALAAGARARCGADIGVGLTGVAGPDPQDGVPVGTWFVAISGPGPAMARRTGDPDDAGRSRAAIRARAVRAALDLLADAAHGRATVS